MLRDRMPKMLDLALRWCKAKDRWINYVYDNIIRKYPSEKRSVIVKTILGIKQQYKHQEIYDTLRYVEFKPITMEQVKSIPKSELYMKFSETIDWNTLSKDDPDMYNYWKAVADWVDWFSTSYTPIQCTYELSQKWKMGDDDIRPILMSKYEIDSKLTEYLINSFK